jgi:uncharacterized Zn finger protein
MDFEDWPDYVPVAHRRAKAERELAVLRKQGRQCQPVVIEGRKIARTFWGAAWCDNLEAYSDFANRLPRGRSYVRNGAVVDLAIDVGAVSAVVSGSDLYEVGIAVRPQPKTAWSSILKECTGKIGSLVDLLQGKLSPSVMTVVTREKTGLFPTPGEISFRCSCPDGASMCKHVAAVLYGVGARLDTEPGLLFRLRHVDPEALIRHAGAPTSAAATEDALGGADLSALFGIEIEPSAVRASRISRRRPPPEPQADGETSSAAPRARRKKQTARNRASGS